jgi:hypothetical protein
MQPVSGNHLQPQIIPSQQRKSGPGEASSKIPPMGKNLYLPEDVVNFSRDRSAALDLSLKKEPSIPVSNAEKKALRDSFSVYA